MRTKFTISVVLMIMSVSVSAQTPTAHDLMQQFRYKEVIESLENQPETIENLLLKAESYEKLYNFTNAFIIYQQLLQINPDDIDLITATAECASQAGNTEQALQYWIKADSLSPNNLFLQTKKAMAYYRNTNWQKTIESAQTVFQTDSIPLLLRMTGDAFQNLSDPIWANYYYTKAYEKNPSDHISLNRICEYFYAMQEEGYDTVATMTEKYLNEINPNQISIGQMNGMANYSSGNFDKAIERLKANVELGDSSYTTTYFLGMSNYAKNWYYEAIKWLDMAYNRIRKNKDVNMYYYYGTALGKVKNQKKSVEVLQEGIDMINETSEKLFGFDISMAETYQQSNNPKAIGYYLSAYKRQSDMHNLLYSIAHAYDTMKDYKNAIIYYERFLKTAPKDIDVNNSSLAESEKIDMRFFHYINSLKRIKELQEKLFMQSGKK
ncbi:MAG: tetratricopeptide repeat protein [Bacteroidia bacterium]|nr:tetratricopeptide repeat protein [Bacteroidia bacterium]